MFFLSLLNAAQTIDNNPDVSSSAESLIASYAAELEVLTQIVGTQYNAESMLSSLEIAINVLRDQQNLQPSPETGELQQQINTLRQEVETAPIPSLGTMAALQQAWLPWVTFDNAPEIVPPDVGTVAWDGGTTLGVQMTANVLGRVNESGYYYIKASSTITKGDVVMFTGAVGASGVPTGAPATGVTDGSYIMGIAAESLALNAFGLVQFIGTLKGIDTSAFADGDILWYNPAVTGGLTKTKPSAPNVKVQMAAVINGGSGGSGSILIRVNSGSVLGGTDSNVQFGTLANGDLIQYDSVAQYWKNVPASTLPVGTATNLAGGAAGSVPYQSAPSTTTFLPIGTALQVLKVNAGATAPEWVSGAALTKTDDTNVTLTLGGTPATSLLAATSLTLGWTGQLGLTRGGTNASLTASAGSVIYSTASALAVNTAGSSGDWLKSGGTGAPVWTSPAALTKTDDTNVTVTLGGSASTALLNAASLTLGWTGQLAVSRGGTGLSSFTSGGILYASGTGTLATGSGLTTDGVNVSQIGTSPLLTLQDNASANNSRLLLQAQSGAVYISTTYSGSNIPMIFSVAGTSTGTEVFRVTTTGKLNVTGLTASKVVFTDVSKDLTSTGTVGVDQGGTGAATFTANGVLYGSGTSALGVTAAGSTGQVLVGNTSAAPSWSNATSVAVTSISFGTTGLTPNSATQGVVTVAGTLVAGNGGTGQSSYTVGDLLYATGATALSKLGIGASTTILTSSGTAPQWSAASGVTVGTATNLAGGVAGSVPYQTAADTTTMLGIGASGRWLGSSGTAPQWNAPAALTKTDDTNVTLTLGGSASSALLNAASLTLGWTGTLAVARGGIGTGTAGITAFNNITGYTAAGATGTTSTNLVFSTSPTLTTPKATTTIGVGNATAAASGAGITFPATDSASSDVNTLDDYEEGTWTPNDASGAGLTFTTKSGMYTKIGRVVYWQALVVYPTTASGLDSLIGGFPFASYGGPGAEGRSGSTITATDETTLVQSLLIETTPQLRFYKAGFVRNTNAELSGNTVYFAGFYVVS